MEGFRRPEGGARVARRGAAGADAKPDGDEDGAAPMNLDEIPAVDEPAAPGKAAVPDDALSRVLVTKRTRVRVYTYGLPVRFVMAIREEVRRAKPDVGVDELDEIVRNIAQKMSPWARPL
jgi:hypothetical protein